MSTPLRPRKRGRPPRHPVDVLRTRLWFHVVQLRSGLKTPHAIELALEAGRFRETSDGIRRPSKWEGYEDGSRVPTPRPGKVYAVEVAEAAYRGTAAYFDNPVWSVLKREVTEVRDVNALLHSLTPEVVEVLVEEVIRGGEPEKIFGDFDEQSIAKLVAIGSLDSLAAALLLTLKSELIGSPILRDAALECYFRLQPGISAMPELQPFAKELFLLIDTTCKHWVFPTTQSRLEVVIFTDGVRDHLER